MKKGFGFNSILLPGILLLLLIIDNKVVIEGTADGIEQCLQVIIPSLFPFFFITGWFNNRLLNSPMPFMTPLRKLLGLPMGCESILITGLLGGYPVGAKTIADVCNSRVISKRTAHILLGYCNNAGPAFIFGICHILFSDRWMPWVIWFVQILSAIITGLILPRPESAPARNKNYTICSLTGVLKTSISVTAIVCGWIILFKILLRILAQTPFTRPVLSYAAGILELSNGCLVLTATLPLSLRFLLFSVFLSCGGLCVYLQTASAVASIGTGLYLPGKCMQTAVSTLISIPISILLFQEIPMPVAVFVPVIGLCIILIGFLSSKCRNICGNYEQNRI